MDTSEYIQHGAPATGESPRHSTELGMHYLVSLLEHGGKVALVQQVDGVEVSVTYSELLRHGKVVAGLLRQHGLGSGDTVMLCCGNTLDFPPIVLGAMFVGAALAPINPVFIASDMLHLIDTIKPQIVICNAQEASLVQEALTQYNTPVEFIPMEAVNKRLKENPGVEDFYLGKIDDPDTHVAFVLCSSGTTGKPKGVEMTHSGFGALLDIASLFPPHGGSVLEQEVVLNLAGPFWISCQTVLMFSLTYGYKLVLLDVSIGPGLDDVLLGAIQNFKINIAVMALPHLVAIAKRSPSSPEYNLSSLRCLMYGGAKCSLELQQLAQNTLRTPIVTIYAMTECVGFSPGHGVVGHPGAVGRIVAHGSVKIVDRETQQILGPNEHGEVCIKSNAVFKGYRGNPEITASRFDEDGFFHTGDIGYYDQDGYFYVIDRMNDCFKYNGVHVYPGDIEEVVLQHPAVLQAAVVGIFHAEDFARATAFIVRRPGTSVTEQELVKIVEDKLPDHKRLHGGVRFLDALPRTATGKVKKTVLRDSLQT